MQHKILRAWDSGKNKVRYVYHDPESGRTNLGEEKTDWFFYVKTKDFNNNKPFFKFLEEQYYVTKYEHEHTYTRVYVDREHNSELLDKNMEFVWEYKDKQLNYILGKLMERNIQHYEADLKVYQRWIIANDVQFESEHKLVFLDIETDDSKMSGQPIPGEFQILSCAFCDSEGKAVCLIAKDMTDEAEEELLVKMAKVINHYDVLVAFNGLNFDFPYIKARFEKYGIQIDWRKKFLQDHMVIYKKLGPALPSYSLDSIAKFVLGEGKVEHEEGITEMFLNNPKLFREYNTQDVMLMYKIEQKTNFLSVAREVNTIGRCPCDDLFISRKIDMMVLLQAYEDGHFHFKTKEYQEKVDDDDEQFIGAFVKTPSPGLYENVQVFDFSSLYPNTIKTFNISPDTLVTEENKNDIPDGKIINCPSGHSFRKDFVGIIPKVIASTADKRNYYKKLLKTVQPGTVEHKTYDRLQYVFKYFGLSFYGVIGMKTSRFYDIKVAESVTLGGQFFIKKVMEYLEKNGLKSVYGDSVTGDRCTWIVKNGCIRLVSFEELFNLADVIIENTDKERRVFSNPIFTASYNFELQKMEFKKIDQIIRHKATKDIFIYRCRDGVTFCTEDHSVINEHGKCFSPKTPNYDAKKVTIPKYKKWERIIDLKDFIDEYSYSLKRNKKIELKFNNKDIYMSNSIGTFDRFLDTKDTVRVKKLLKLMAHYICNGSSSTIETTKSRFGASITCEDEVLIEELKSCYNVFFHGYYVNVLKPDYKKREDLAERGWNVVNKCFKLQMMNVLSAVILRQLCGQKAYGKRIPDFVYMLSEDLQLFFLKELIAGDGSIERGCMTLETSSLKLISGISLIMDNLKIKHSVNYNPKTRTYSISEYKNGNHGKHLIKNRSVNLGKTDGYVYDISVNGNNNFVDACGNILLHNTDSCFFVLKDLSKIPLIISNITKLCDYYAKKQFNCDICTLEMAYDKGFSKYLLIAKKRYAGYVTYLDGHKLDEPKLYVAGLEFKRTDVCKLVKIKQEELLKSLLAPENMPLTIARKFVEDLKAYLFGKNVNLVDITFGQKLTKNAEDYKAKTAHLKVVAEMKEDGEEVWVGDKIQYFIEGVDKDGKGVPKPIYKFAGVFARTYYWNKKIFPALQRLLSVVYKEVDWDNYLITNKKSTARGAMDLW